MTKLKLLIIVFIALFALYDAKKSYNGYSVYRLIPESLKQLKFLKRLAETESNENVNFWTEPYALNASVDVMISPQYKKQFQVLLKNNKLINRITVPNVQKLISEETSDQDNDNVQNYPKQDLKKPNSTHDYFAEYQTLANVENFIKTIASENPTLASTEVIGKSSEGHHILVLKLGNKNSSNAIWIESTIHAAEWITTATNAYIVQQLVDGYKNNITDIENLLNKFEWYFLLVINPDGYYYTHTKDRLWRKTRARFSNSTCRGTDANRNFDNHWGEAGARNDSCSGIYQGPKPFSEPETRAIRDKITELKNRLKIYISFHSYSQLFMHPWGYTKTNPPNFDDLRSKSNIAVNALTAKYGTKYKIGAPPHVIYAASGGALDRVYDNAGVKHSYTLELRDNGTYGFLLPKSQIKPTGEETWAGLKAMIESIAKDLNAKKGH